MRSIKGIKAAIDAFIDRRGLRHYLSVWLLGALASAAMPPAYFFPAIIFGIAFLYYAISRAPSARQAAWDGLAFHFGYFMAGLYWISFAFLVDGGFVWMIPFSAIGLPAFLALYGGILGYAAHRASLRWRFFSTAHGFLFAALFFSIEWLRGYLFTGFPWNVIGYSVGFSDILSQTASIVGVYGLGVCVVMLALGLLFLIFKNYRFAGGVLLLWSGMAIFGWLRLDSAENSYISGVTIRLVQANIEQKIKWDRQAARENFAAYLRLSSLPAAAPITHIVWPESAVPFPVDQNKAPRMEIARVVPKFGTVILGAPRGEYDSDGNLSRLYNSIVAIDRSAEIIAEYDKVHLVPFGEYVPLPHWLGISKLAHGMLDYSAGSGAMVAKIPGLPPFAPSICYESIFPGEIIGQNIAAEWLLNVTNDGWYGKTAGPYQHLAHARMRAIEQGLPMIRAANTGISALIDPYGRIVSSLGVGETGVLDVGLPKPAKFGTIYRNFR